MKKILLFISLAVGIFSCTATQQNQTIIDNKKPYISVYKIKNHNEIDNLTLKDKLDLKNKEINLYHIKDLKIKGIPKITLDINYEQGKSDSFLITKSDKGKVLLEFNNLGNNKTIKKDILIARLPKDTNLEFKLFNEYQVIDNTVFNLEEELVGEFKWIKLIPYFIDEDTYEEKAKENIVIEPTVAFYENNLIIEQTKETKVDSKTYKIVEAKLGNGKVIKGTATPNAKLILEFDNFNISTIVDENGKFSTIMPDSYTGDLKIIQIKEVNKKILLKKTNINLKRIKGD